MGPGVYGASLTPVPGVKRRRRRRHSASRAARVPLPLEEERRRRRHARAHAPAEVARAPVRRRRRAPVGVEAREVEPEPLGARPQVRVLEAALVGEQRVVHRPERVLARGRLGRAGGGQRPRVARAHREVAEGDAQRQPASRGLDRGAERALVVPVDDHQRGAAGPRTRSSGPSGGSGAEPRSVRPRAASASKIRLAPGRSPGEGASWLQRTTPSGPISTSARCGKPAGCRTRTPGTRRPWARSPTAARCRSPSCSLNAVCDHVASQETP